MDEGAPSNKCSVINVAEGNQPNRWALIAGNHAKNLGACDSLQGFRVSGRVRVRSRNRFPSRRLSLHPHSIQNNTCCPYQSNKHKQHVYIYFRCRPLRTPWTPKGRYLLFILRLPSFTVKPVNKLAPGELGALPHYNLSLFLAEIQYHRFVQLDRVLFAIDADDQVRGSRCSINRNQHRRDTW